MFKLENVNGSYEKIEDNLEVPSLDLKVFLCRVIVSSNILFGPRNELQNKFSSFFQKRFIVNPKFSNEVIIQKA